MEEQPDEGLFLYALGIEMDRVDALEAMDPYSVTTKRLNDIIEACNDDQLKAICRARLPWLASRAVIKLINRRTI